MKIGLFGGTFNPIHRCHVTVAQQTRELLSLDRILFIPSADPPHKPPGTLAPAHHRAHMVRLAIAEEPAFLLSEVELKRAGRSYSIDTVKELRTEYGPGTALFFIVGLDAFVEFPTWHRASDLLTLCHFVVISRPGGAFTRLAGLHPLPPIDSTALSALDAGRLDRFVAPLPSGHSLTLLHLPPCDASASDIRQRLRRGLSVATLLPPQIESYIIRFRLYQEDRNLSGI
jgi:nicotinate-nucleotide adenylyltransferase